jgi:putative membrane protein insertion efficiency factor
VRWVAILLIRIYQLTLSRILPPVCRFEPTCSRYAVAALQKHGFIAGMYLAARRILRCHPGNPGGYDPVPEDPWGRKKNEHDIIA